MKTIPSTPAVWLGFAAFAVAGWAQEAAPVAPVELEPPAAEAPPPRGERSPANLKFNFRGAPLETVLNYMSEAAGYVIVLDTPVIRGTVDMWSAQPVSREEAVQLLNVALNKNGYAASVQGRNLIVASKDEAKKRNLPIHTGNDPAAIPETAEMVMQIIPLRRLDATTAARDLGTMMPGSATLTPNVETNSLVVTDTQMNVKHIVEIVSALDTSTDTVSTMRVFRLRNADPVEMAALIMNAFGTTGVGAQNGAQGRNGAGQFGQFGQGGFGGFGQVAAGFAQAAAAAGGGGGRGGFAGGNNGRTGGRNGATGASGGRTPVVAVADPRTYSIIVSASKDAMPEISTLIAQLDSSPARKQKVYVYTLENADTKQVETILRNLFQSTTNRTTTTNQTNPLTTRANNNTQTSASSSSLSIGSNSGARGGN